MAATPKPPAASSERTIELHIPSELGWERAAMDVAGSVARLMGFPADRIDDIRTAVAEATINAIEHGNRLDASQKVFILFAPEGTSLKIDIHDHSTTPFEPVAQAPLPPNMGDKLAGLSDTRGWGTFLIKALVDEVEFATTSDGNVVRMVIHLDTRQGAAS